ncbi:hypothetical protein BM477_04415 [Boudabousia marimammalium]|uniref:Purine nucleoside phosphorylase n=1 Tax=Boudabousia marimammalium TaxID=156892 RepID=A0A1Q5PPC5_9ACTO|nr:hypothetical protein BM477_04415 [Boudabousia marimammalium]
MPDFGLAGFSAAFTDAGGGTPVSRYGNFNLGDYVGDDPVQVEDHRQALREWARTPVVWMNQTHSSEVAVVTDVSQRGPVNADGVIVGEGLAAAVLVADCIPVLIATDTQYCAAVHAGRRGISLNIIKVAAEKLRKLGATQLQAALGPHICAKHYEVDQQTYTEMCDVWPMAAASTALGTLALNLGAVARTQLEQSGVVLAHEDSRCTFEHQELYSYRRSGRTGRQCGIIVSPPSS